MILTGRLFFEPQLVEVPHCFSVPFLRFSKHVGAPSTEWGGIATHLFTIIEVRVMYASFAHFAMQQQQCPAEMGTQFRRDCLYAVQAEAQMSISQISTDIFFDIVQKISERSKNDDDMGAREI